MSTTTTRTRKAPATKVADAAAKAPAKAPAKAAPAKPAAEKEFYAATARSGQVARRQASQPMTAAVDVAEPEATNARANAGRIWKFFPTQEAAQAYADKLNGQGLDAIVTTAEVAK